VWKPNHLNDQVGKNHMLLKQLYMSISLREIARRWRATKCTHTYPTRYQQPITPPAHPPDVNSLSLHLSTTIH